MVRHSFNGSHIIIIDMITLTYPVIFIGLINVRCAATAEQKTGHHTGHSLYRSTTPLLFVRSHRVHSSEICGPLFNACEGAYLTPLL